MRRIHVLDDPLLAAHLRHLLEAEGLEVLLRNESLRMASGEVPPVECWLEIWVRDDADAPRAARLISEALAVPEPSTPRWTCPGCREVLEGVFDACWSCGADRVG